MLSILLLFPSFNSLSQYAFIQVPHLFRCKKCVFVCGTKTSMDVHKNAEHRKLMPFQDPGNDDILVVYDSSAPAALQNKVFTYYDPQQIKTAA